jgi:hypothetical protein
MLIVAVVAHQHFHLVSCLNNRMCRSQHLIVSSVHQTWPVDSVFDNANGLLTDYKSYRLVGLICPDNMLFH